jgi:hypothetical protein
MAQKRRFTAEIMFCLAILQSLNFGKIMVGFRQVTPQPLCAKK